MRASFRLRCGLLLAWLIGPALGASAGEDAKAKEPSAAENAIAALLTADVTPGKSRPEAIAPLYDRARALAPRDPRLEYAYSLVLLRMFQAGEAREHLDRALALDPLYAQANQSVIRDLLKNKKFVEAGERLAAFAARLDPSRAESAEVAEWLGRVTGAVTAAVGTPDARTQFAYQDRMLRSSLPAVLRSRYEKGFADVERELAELTGSIESAQSTAEEQRMATKAKVDADLLKDQQEIKLKQQDAEKSRKKWDEWISDQTAKADDLLREQEKRYQDLDRSVNTQIQSITGLRMMLLTNNNTMATNLQQPQVAQPQGQGQSQQQGRRRNTQTPIAAFTPPNPQSVELQLMVEERRLAALYDQQAGVANDAARTLAARRQAVAKYQQATGVVMKEAANLDRWEKRNQTIAENQKKAAEKKPVQVATLEARIKSWNTWDPGDFETEKRRLLADLGVVVGK